MSILAPLFKCMGSVTYMGPAGSGQSCKLANQVHFDHSHCSLNPHLLHCTILLISGGDWLAISSQVTIASTMVGLVEVNDVLFHSR
jgi:hypothetical protein